MVDDGTIRPLLMVSNSEIMSFKLCRRKWNLSSFNRNNLVPLQPNPKFWVGTAGHYALERWHGHGEDPVRAFEQWTDKQIFELRERMGARISTDFLAMLGEIRDEGREIIEHYRRHAERTICKKYEFLAVELEFSVPIPNVDIPLQDADGNWYPWVVERWGSEPFLHEEFHKLYGSRDLVWRDERWGYYCIPPLYVGRIDAIVRDKSNGLWIMDHKFMANLVDPEVLQIDEQTSKYTWAATICMQNGWWPEFSTGGAGLRGAIYNVIRKKVPVVPEMVGKEGNKRTSKAKNIDTTPELFRAWLLARRENPDEYQDVLNHLASRGNRFFQTEEILRGPHEIALIEQRIIHEYTDMARVAQEARSISHPALYPTPRPDCKWACGYKQICYVANNGGDVRDLVRTTMRGQERTDMYASMIQDDMLDNA